MRPRIKPQLCTSTEERKREVCKEIARIDRRTNASITVPVLFMWGKPVRMLSESQALEYKALGARIEMMDKNEVIIK